MVGAWIGNLLFLLPGISLPFYIWKKYPFRSVANEESFTAASDNENNSTDYISSVSRANSTSNPNQWLHQSDGTSVDVKPIYSDIKKTAPEKGNSSASKELDYKLDQLDQLHKDGILTQEELEQKATAIKSEFRKSAAQKQIDFIRHDRISKIKTALNSGVLSKDEAQVKIKQIEETHICPHCDHMNDSSFEYCPNCGRNLLGEFPQDTQYYFCEHCDYKSIKHFNVCPKCGKTGAIANEDSMQWFKDTVLGFFIVAILLIVVLAIAGAFSNH